DNFHMPSDSIAKYIKEVTRKLCPVTYCFTAESDTLDKAAFWGGKNFSFQSNRYNSPPLFVKDIIISSNCYNGNRKLAERDVAALGQRVGHIWYPHKDISKEGAYVYIVSEREKKLPEMKKETSYIFSIYFERDEYNLKPGEQVHLQTLISDSISSKALITITGYTDDTGEAQLNKKLSEQRANAIRDYFLSNGIGTGQISECSGKGVLDRKKRGVEVAEDRRVDIIVKY
ncbi:MAG TPA: OmpA family protein, partial [Flavipsychrobacter sp.]|nr:OmpA family protein [Flavipsychrobacter sp.]